MQTFLEHLGVSVAAITGVLAAKGKRVDLFGVLVLALVTAFGGGIYLYATAAIFGAIGFVILEKLRPGAVENAAVRASLTFGLRQIGIRRRITLPVFDDTRED
jgi:uncharacterized membrane protein YeiH